MLLGLLLRLTGYLDHWIDPDEAEEFNRSLQQRFRESLDEVRQTKPPEDALRVLAHVDLDVAG